MRNEIFKSMSVNKQRFIDEIKSGKNPNYLKNRVEEGCKKTEKVFEQVERLSLQQEKTDVSIVTTLTEPVKKHPLQPSEMPLLRIERVCDEKKQVSVMERLGIVRRYIFVKNRLIGKFCISENFLRKIYEWFEVVCGGVGERS